MESASTRFFGVPELAIILAGFLTRKEAAQLALVSKRLHRLCTPVLFFQIELAYIPHRSNLFGTPSSTLVLAENINKVRWVDLHWVDLVYYYNSVVVGQDLDSQSLIVLPQWLPQPDPPQPGLHLTPLQPMTQLTRLGITFDRKWVYRHCPYLLPSYDDPRAAVAQSAWIIQANPHLQEVKLTGIAVKDDQDVSLLMTAIFRLSKLKDLDLQVSCSSEIAADLPLTLFFSCPPSTEVLRINIDCSCEEEDSMAVLDYIDEEAEDIATDFGRSEPWVIPRRQEPLMRLTYLRLWELNIGDDISEETLRSVFQHCPNIQELDGPLVDDAFEHDGFVNAGGIIGELCTKLTTLTCNIPEGPRMDVLPFRIMKALPEQQLRVMECKFSDPVQAMFINGDIFQRHSMTLTTIALCFSRAFKSTTVATILAECNVLEVFTAEGIRGLYVDLNDAIARPWACTGIRELALSITLEEEVGLRTCQKQSIHSHMPVDQETLLRFEHLYRQLGSLIELSSLDIRLESFGEYGVSRIPSCPCRDVFPGMLRLPGADSDLRGYLHLFSRLTKMTKLRGSFCAGGEETKQMLNQDVAAWIHKHWPQLEEVAFFPECVLLPASFQWLVN